MEIDPLYFVLGFLNEYNGRTVSQDQADVVESFFADEAQKAGLFRESLESLAKQRGISESIETGTNEAGWIIFRSDELAALINGCYQVEKPGDFEGSRNLLASWRLFIGKSRTEELSFLAGAYARFGEGRLFRMANAQHKVDLIAKLLAQYGCKDMSVTYYPTYVPRVFSLSFEASREISEWFAGCAAEG